MNPPNPEVDFAPLGFNGSAPTIGKSIDIVKFLMSRWKSLATGLLIGTLVGLCAYLYLGPAYLATTRVQVSRPASLPNDRGAQSFTERATHPLVIASDVVLGLAYRDHGLNKVDDFSSDADPLKEIAAGLIVKRSAGQDNSIDNILEISYQHPTKAIAKQTLEAIVDAYKDWLEEVRETKSKELREGLMGQKRELETEITNMEDESLEWRARQPIQFKSPPVMLGPGGQPIVQQSYYEKEVERARTSIASNESQKNKVRARMETLRRMARNPESRESLEVFVRLSMNEGFSAGDNGGGGGGGGGGGASALIDSPQGKGELDSRLLTARIQEQLLLGLVGSNHAEVKKVRREIATILDYYKRLNLTPPDLRDKAPSQQSPSAQFKGVDLADVYLRYLETRLAELEAQDRTLSADLKKAEDEAKTASLVELQDQKRKEKIAQKRKELDKVAGDLADLRQSVEHEGFRMTPISDIRVEKSMKRFLKIVGAFAVLGLLAIFGLQYLREWLDSTLRTIDEVRNAVQAPVMAAVPKFHHTYEAEQHALATGLSPALVYYHRPGSREAEAYRSVRTSLFFGTQDTGEKVIQFTSAQPGDGKTTSASNLAIAMAQSGKRVLLIDADLRRPTVHVLFGVAQEPGLADVLQRKLSWKEVIHDSQVEGLSIINSGACPENPAELLSTSVLPQVLKELRSEFDFILIDTPPVLAVSDPCIISPYVDGLMLIVRLEKNRRPAVVRTRETLEAHGVRLLGVIANDLDKNPENSGYGYESYDTYYNSTSSEAPKIKAPSISGTRR